MPTITGFEDCYKILLGDEGGYVDNPKDPGGETMYGVTKRVAMANGYYAPMKDLPLETAKGIAKKEYWDKFHCDQFDPLIGLQIFDAAYNGGHPVQWLQLALGVAPDGVIGAKTVAAVRGADPLKVAVSIACQRIFYDSDLTTWQDFGKGWARRIANNLLRSLG